ncbi:MAG: ECF transporter S component [Clostridiales bacterium]|nr:ECF transporter S component [Clostridiales bacterium]
MNEKVKKMTTVAMLCALAYLVMLIIRFPLVAAIPFVKYDPKDIVISIGGFIFGPVTSFAISVIVSLIEMVTVSESGPIGCLMNVISTCSFTCTAAYIYKKKHSIKGAVTGLIVGTLTMTATMLLWNYLITPIYMGFPRQAVAEMLLPCFLPHNLLKGAINAAVTMLIYKPVVSGLRRGHLIADTKKSEKKSNVGVMLVTAAILITCIFVVLVLNGTLK